MVCREGMKHLGRSLEPEDVALWLLRVGELVLEEKAYIWRGIMESDHVVEQTYPCQMSCPEVTGYPVWVLMELQTLSFSEVGLELKLSSFPWGNLFEVLSSRVLWEYIHVYAMHPYSFSFAAEAFLRGKACGKVTFRTDSEGKKICFTGFSEVCV